MNQTTQSEIIQCRDCPNTFEFTAGEQAFFAEKNLSRPVRCKPCRANRRAQRDQQQGGVPQAPVQQAAPSPDPEWEMRQQQKNGGRKPSGGGRKNRENDYRRRDRYDD